MADPHFIKCEPDWLLETGNSSNFEPNVELPSDKLLQVKVEPDLIFPGRSLEEEDEDVFKEEYDMQEVKSEGSSMSGASTNKIQLSSLNNIGNGPETESCNIHSVQGTSVTSSAGKQNTQKKKVHSCEICGKTYTKRSTLNIHMLSHTGERPHVCSSCGKGFTKHSHLKAHTLIHSGERPFLCTTCGKTFTQRSHFNSHMDVHAGYKPHVCSFCGKTFTDRSNYGKHILTHSGQRPHCCTTCGNSFAHITTLHTHMLTHTGEKPFSCPTCNKAFAHRSTLKKHMLSHEREFESSLFTSGNIPSAQGR